MTIISKHNELFHIPVLTEKMDFLRLLVDSNEINTDIAFALLNNFHRELSQKRAQDPSAYKNYAGTIQSLEFTNADLLKKVVAAWNGTRAVTKGPEWLSGGLVK